MKFIAYNFFPICLLILSGLMMHWNKPNWGWLIVAAIIMAVFPTSSKKTTDD